ncbi:MAG TPA: Fic family protein [Actinobacteria bacterium]|nr:adenosine monophosphate-protein transferase SoFic [bacterium BMS3Bbin01]HDH27268.1 Fic family protein [Actinomycetota bacterium]
MAEYLRKRWEPRFERTTRRDRQGCSYDAYLPDPLAGWNLTLPASLAADIADAETAIRDLNETGTSHVSLEGLARFLLRAESVASSKIEGLDAGPRRLVDAEAALAQGGETADRIAVEVLGNIAAMESAIELGIQAERISVADLLQIHRVLMEHSPRPELGGVIRERQNWIGGSPHDPCSAVFVPPPPEQVHGLVQDLIEYVNADNHSPLTQAAIAHAQFETIHPFADGNGRTGRALIHVILRRRGLSPTFVPPISIVLATWSDDYICGLTTFRHIRPADSPERSLAAHTWLRTFAGATLRACSDAQIYATRIDELVHQWQSNLGTVRKGSALDLLLDALPGVPLLTVESAARLIGRSDVATGAAINRLVDAGILTQRNIGKHRYRIFETSAVLELLTSLEHALAGPTGDTATDEPVRPSYGRSSAVTIR